MQRTRILTEHPDHDIQLGDWVEVEVGDEFGPLIVDEAEVVTIFQNGRLRVQYGGRLKDDQSAIVEASAATVTRRVA